MSAGPPHRSGAAVGALGHDGDWSRRDFVTRLSGAIALAGLEACTRMPAGTILPYAEQPPELTPGRAQWYATSLVLDGLATGVLVESRDGRPIKIEGNPDHPASLGAAGILEQAAVWQLYDPDRGRRPMHGDRPSAWPEIRAAIRAATDANRVGATGSGLALLADPTSSPTDARLFDQLRDRFPNAGVHFHAPLLAPHTWHRDHAMSGLVTRPDFAAARRILAIDSDFLAEGPFRLRHAHDYAAGRAAGDDHRLYVAEASVTVTGGAADHRFTIDPRAVPRLVIALRRLVEGGIQDPAAPAWLGAVARDLHAARGDSLVVLGDNYPAALHEDVVAINRALGNEGRTVRYAGAPWYGAGDPRHEVTPLLEALRAGAVAALVTIGGNPAYALPGESGFARLMASVPCTIHAGLYRDETGQAAEWFLPLAHDLERWGDARALDGTASVVQPLIAPLHDSLPVTSLLAILAGASLHDSHELVRAEWRRRLGAADFDAAWDELLRRGVQAASEQPATATPAPRSPPPFPAVATDLGGFTALLVADPGTHDGRFANVPWLLELPRPITTLTWGNAVHLSPADGARLGVRSGTPLQVRHEDREVVMPALLVPGHAEGCVTLPLGFGRGGGERAANGIGTAVLPLQPASGERLLEGVTIEAVPGGAPVPLARTQDHRDTAGRDPVRMVPMGSRGDGPPASEPSLHAGAVALDATVPQWAMTIDLDRCTGCSACVIACQAENNVPVVGAEEVRRGRAMHWLRIDSYRPHGPDGPAALVQPMLCQQCEHAPCEYVCPVEATVHSPDGLNEMIYNRCVGTRFCSNNCPYKARRFNWFDYTGNAPDLVQLARNPDVTVRARGVMEKCTFCVQRIREADITASVDGRSVGGNDVRTACQQACPTGAIVFGSLTDPASRAALDRDSDRAYDALGELGTRPRVRYLARRRHANPDLGPSA